MKTKIYNPFLPCNEYIPDCEPRVFNNRVYLYGSHDMANGNGYCLKDYVTYSASVDDLSTWNYEGEIYKRNQDPLNIDAKGVMEAPDCVKGPDGRYYLYYNETTGYRFNIAVSDKPEGPFEYYGVVCNKDGTRYNENCPFDPAVLVDEEKVYLYYGFVPPFPIKSRPIPKTDGAYVIELDKDMKTVIGETKLVLPARELAKNTPFEGHSFFEAASIRKYDGWYYLVYDSDQVHELCYASSKYPDRDFAFGGTIISNGDIGYKNITKETARNNFANIHGGLMKVKDNYYICYHRHTNGTQFSRQSMMEKVNIKDGKISHAEMTSFGLSGGCVEAKGTYPSYIATELRKGHGGRFIPYGPRVIDSPYITEEDNQQIITNIKDDCTIGFRYFKFDGSEKEMVIEYEGKGNLILLFEEGKARAILNDSKEWNKVSLKFSKIKGKLPVTLKFSGDGNFRLKSFEIR